MNELVLIDGVQTMDSRDIAERTGKDHRNICRDIVAQLGKLEGGVLRFEHTYCNAQNGQMYTCYRLPYRETMILVSGYSVELRAKVVDRWMELEHAAALASFNIPKTYAEALQLASDQAKEIEQKSQALIEAAPKIESYDAMMKSEATMNISRCAKHFALHPKKVVFPYLRAHGYLIKDSLPSQSAINADILSLVSHKDRFTEVVRLQAVVRTRQLEKWRTYLVPRIIAWDKEREGDQDE